MNIKEKIKELFGFKRADMKNLSSSARYILENKTISKKLRISEWISILEELETFDKKTDELLKNNKDIAVLCTFFTCISLLTLYGFFKIESSLYAKITMCITAFFWIRVNGCKSINLINDFRETLLPFLKLIKDDFSKKKIAIFLDLEPIQYKNHISQDKLQPPSISCTKLIQTIYKSNIAKIQIPLDNELSLNIAIHKTAIKRYKEYKTKGGRYGNKTKYKGKTKWKLLSSIKTTILLPHDVKVNNNHILDKMHQGHKDNMQFYSLKIKDKSKAVKECPEFCFHNKQIIKMMMQLCAIIQRNK